MDALSTKILILSANPRNTKSLRLDEERREIESGLIERSRLRDQFHLITKVAVRPRDCQRAMLDHSPQIVHFSGHGSGERGIALEDETGNLKLVDAAALAALFALYEDTLQCVVLNACYSEVQAKAIVEHIPYAIGMSDKIKDRAAIEFAVAFYDALGAGRDVEFAYKNARVAIQMAGIPQSDVPVLHKKSESETYPLQAPTKSMTYHNLTEKQVLILKWIVQEVRAGRLNEQAIDVVYDLAIGHRILSNSTNIPDVELTTFHALETDNCLIGSYISSNHYRYALTRRAYEIANYTSDPTPPSQPYTSVSNPLTPQPQPAANSEPLSVFISYSHRDEAFKDELVVHLANLKRQGKIKAWQDRDIEAGAEWDAEIKQQLESAEIILLLITPRFLASNYCFDLEMQRALQRHNEQTARVIPIIVKHCDWQDAPFSKLQVLPKDAKPVTKWDDQDEAFLNVVQGIRRAVESLQAKK